MPLFTAPRVVLDGEVRGKLLRQQPWLWVEASPGAHIVGIDLGKTPQARQRVQTAAGEIRYLRYERVTTQKLAGFLDSTMSTQANLQEVSASDAASDLDRLAGQGKRSGR
jgi:hypothetical protein